MNPTTVKVASIIAGVVVLAIAVFGPGLTPEIRGGLILMGGFLLGYPVAAPGAGKAGMLLLALALPPALTGCASTAAPKDGASVRRAAQGAYTGAALLIRAVDDLAARAMDAAQNPTPEQIKAAESVVAVLKSARDALEKARPCIADGGSCGEQFGDVANWLLTASVLASDLTGKPLPPEISGVLDFVLAYAGKDGAK
jgi:hypothetical protein